MEIVQLKVVKAQKWVQNENCYQDAVLKRREKPAEVSVDDSLIIASPEKAKSYVSTCD